MIPLTRVQSLSRESANAVLDVEQKTWLEHDEATITLNTAEDARLIERINAHAINLEDLCDFSLGITPYDKYSGHTPEQIEGQVFHAKAQLGSDYKRLLRIGDVRRYEVTWNGEDWIKYGDWLAAPRRATFFHRRTDTRSTDHRLGFSSHFCHLDRCRIVQHPESVQSFGTR